MCYPKAFPYFLFDRWHKIYWSKWLLSPWRPWMFVFVWEGRSPRNFPKRTSDKLGPAPALLTERFHYNRKLTWTMKRGSGVSYTWQNPVRRKKLRSPTPVSLFAHSPILLIRHSVLRLVVPAFSPLPLFRLLLPSSLSGSLSHQHTDTHVTLSSSNQHLISHLASVPLLWPKLLPFPE